MGVDTAVGAVRSTEEKLKLCLPYGMCGSGGVHQPQQARRCTATFVRPGVVFWRREVQDKVSRVGRASREELAPYICPPSNLL